MKLKKLSSILLAITLLGFISMFYTRENHWSWFSIALWISVICGVCVLIIEIYLWKNKEKIK